MTTLDLTARANDLSCLCPKRREVLGHILTDTAHLNGEVWECGAFRGGTALGMRIHLDTQRHPRYLRVFDTFAGMPLSGEHDIHQIGSFSETTYAGVRALFEDDDQVSIHQGVMPATFAGLEASEISVAHIDVDQYESVLECLRFVYPRIQPGGYVVLDDYNCPGCPGAKRAVEEFMADKGLPLLQTRGTPQAFFTKPRAPFYLPFTGRAP